MCARVRQLGSQSRSKGGCTRYRCAQKDKRAHVPAADGGGHCLHCYGSADSRHGSLSVPRSRTEKVGSWDGLYLYTECCNLDQIMNPLKNLILGHGCDTPQSSSDSIPAGHPRHGVILLTSGPVLERNRDGPTPYTATALRPRDRLRFVHGTAVFRKALRSCSAPVECTHGSVQAGKGPPNERAEGLRPAIAPIS